MRIPVSGVSFNPYDTREDFGDLEGLKQSIGNHGLFQPFLVRPLKEKGKFELAFGGRRFRSCLELGYGEVDVEVREIDNGDMVTLALCENVHRKDLTPVELAKAYRRGLDATKLSVNSFSQVIGESGVKIQSYLNILNLPDRILKNQDRYNVTQITSLGKLNNVSRNVRILLEDHLKGVNIGANFLKQIVSSCESIYASRLSDKKKLELSGEVIIHDYSHLPPGNHGHIRVFSDELLKRELEQYDERLRKKTQLFGKNPTIPKKKKDKPVKSVEDIVDYDGELEEVTLFLRKAYDKIQRVSSNGFYEQASRRGKRKFKTSVNKLTSGLEQILGNGKES
jgi:ParB family chromosome partitioning protein